MQEILYRFRRYYPWYDRQHKVLSLKGKIPVKDFVELKRMLKLTKEEVEDIRVNI